MGSAGDLRRACLDMRAELHLGGRLDGRACDACRVACALSRKTHPTQGEGDRAVARVDRCGRARGRARGPREGANLELVNDPE